MQKEKYFYFDPITQRYRYRTNETYKDVKWTCTGYSKNSKEDAKRDWKKKRDKRIEEIECKFDRKKGRIKLSKDMPEWYEVHMRNKTTNGRPRSALTIDTDMITMKQIFKELGKYDVCDIDADLLQRYFNKLADDGASKSTIHKRWILLNQYFNQRNPQENPIIMCHMPQTKRIAAEYMVDDEEEVVANRAYTDDEMERLRDVLLTTPLGKNRELAIIRGHMLIVTMYQYLRVGEVTELRVRDIDFAARKIRIKRQYDEVHKEVVIPKDNSKRTMHIAEECFEILQDACEGKDANDLVFNGADDNEHDGHVLRGALRDTLTAACELAGIERHTVHDLRHDGISYCVRKGARNTSIQKWAGHKSLTVTMDTYYQDCGEDDPKDIELVTGVKVKKEDNCSLDKFADQSTEWLISIAQAAMEELSKRGVILMNPKPA